MQNGEQYMEQKRKFTKSLIRPIFNALIGLIMLLSFAIGIVGYILAVTMRAIESRLCKWSVRGK